MQIDTFSSQTGNLSYKASLNYPSGDLLYFGLGYTGDPGLVRKITFSGSSGKFSDQDSNFFMGLYNGLVLNLSGNIFTGHHSYFINTSAEDYRLNVRNGRPDEKYILANNNASRVTGAINCIFFDSTPLQGGNHPSGSLFRARVLSQVI